MPFGNRAFNFGANIAWLYDYYDHDLSDSLVYGTSAAYDDQLLDGFFRHLAHRGMKVVRYWVFERLEGMIIQKFPPPPSPPPAPQVWPNPYASGNPPRITGIKPNLKNNVRKVMDKAKAYNLELYWCLHNAWISNKSDGDRLAREVLRYIIKNPITRQSFITNALQAFLACLSTKDSSGNYLYKNHVFAIDLINEPEGTKLDWKYIKDYISAIAPVVSRHGFKWSVGFQKKDTILKHKSDLQSLNIDFYDYHIYNSSGNLKPYSSLNLDKPCIIGEFGHEDKKAKKSNTVSDDEQYETDKKFMINAIDKGYAGCLIWRYTPIEKGDPLSQRILKLGTGGNKPFNAFKKSFLSAAGSNPTKNMNDPNWKADHERKVWQAIEEFVTNKGPFR